jgi:tetratricopeptide (TPR) repeat protein
LSESDEAEEAVKVLRPLVDLSPLDMQARACFARALARTGDHEEARRQVSVVLTWNSAWVEGYVLRAASAAEMGSVSRAMEDLELARILDPEDRNKQLVPATERIERRLAKQAEETATKPRASLLAAAHTDIGLEQLARLATDLLRASNRERRLGDETYSDRRRTLEWARIVDPNDPDRSATLGHFLLDEVDVAGESVEPTGYVDRDRLQEKALKEAELREARRLFHHALELKPEHGSSLIGLARLEVRDRMWNHAEQYLRRALATGTHGRTVLQFLREVMQPATAQRSATVATLRMTFRWEEALENTLYEYSQEPSATQLGNVDDYDAQAARLHRVAQAYVGRALKTLSNDPASHDFVGAMAYAARDWTAAARAWEKAVHMAPDVPSYHQSLARASWQLGRDDAYLEQASIGQNLTRTSAGIWLEAAWDLIAAWQPDRSSGYLDKAESVDPGEVRALAYRAVIAESRQDQSEALSLYRAAFALEEARANERGGSWITGDGSWAVRDTGRAIELRSRIADLLGPDRPEQAAGLYLKNVVIETWFREAALKEPVDQALLPVPDLPEGTRQVAPTFGELMRTNRAWAAVALAKLGRCQEAAEHFRRLPEYDRFAGGGRARDLVWKTGPVAEAAVNCFELVGDRGQLDAWNQRLGQEPVKVNPRRLSLTQAGPSGRVGRPR